MVCAAGTVSFFSNVTLAPGIASDEDWLTTRPFITVCDIAFCYKFSNFFDTGIHYNANRLSLKVLL